jgi:hypothetical protein
MWCPDDDDDDDGECCSVCRLLQHGARDVQQLEQLVAPMSQEELLQVGVN